MPFISCVFYTRRLLLLPWLLQAALIAAYNIHNFARSASIVQRKCRFCPLRSQLLQSSRFGVPFGSASDYGRIASHHFGCRALKMQSPLPPSLARSIPSDLWPWRHSISCRIHGNTAFFCFSVCFSSNANALRARMHKIIKCVIDDQLLELKSAWKIQNCPVNERKCVPHHVHTIKRVCCAFLFSSRFACIWLMLFAAYTQSERTAKQTPTDRMAKRIQNELLYGCERCIGWTATSTFNGDRNGCSATSEAHRRWIAHGTWLLVRFH